MNWHVVAAIVLTVIAYRSFQRIERSDYPRLARLGSFLMILLLTQRFLPDTYIVGSMSVVMVWYVGVTAESFVHGLQGGMTKKRQVAP